MYLLDTHLVLMEYIMSIYVVLYVYGYGCSGCSNKVQEVSEYCTYRDQVVL